MVKRIVALSIIFACSWTAWALLTLVINLRTDEKSDTMWDAVGDLWGSEQSQTAPTVSAQWVTQTKREIRRVGSTWEYVAVNEEVEVATENLPGDKAAQESGGEERRYDDPSVAEPALPSKDAVDSSTPELISREVITEKVKVEEEKEGKGKRKKKDEEKVVEKKYEISKYLHKTPLALLSSDVAVDLDVEHRKKGLLWFATYKVGFDSSYKVVNPHDHPVEVTAVFDYPSTNAVYDNMMIKVAGAKDLVVDTENGRMSGRFTVPSKAEMNVVFGYGSRGLDRWNYRFGDNVKLVENFRLDMNTNFDAIDFPAGSISPDKKEKREGEGWKLTWKKDSLVSGLEIGMLMPRKINPGPLAAAMSFHAPVSLFFFFFLLFIIQVLKKIDMHPMNYFFIAASFFAFNLLFSYLVSHLDIYLAFGIASGVSIFLVVSYLRIVVGNRFALVEAGLCQLVYQVLFSLAHFMEGYTGLTVTIGAILTLAVVMRLTARVDWKDVFKSKNTPNMAVGTPVR